jgi:hypothetical protein
MPPALLLLRFGRRHRLLLPLPLFLLWPLLLLGWLGLGLAWLAMPVHRRPEAVVAGVAALRMLGELRGTRVDFQGRDASMTMQFV